MAGASPGLSANATNLLLGVKTALTISSLVLPCLTRSITEVPRPGLLGHFGSSRRQTATFIPQPQSQLLSLRIETASAFCSGVRPSKLRPVIASGGTGPGAGFAGAGFAWAEFVGAGAGDGAGGAASARRDARRHTETNRGNRWDVIASYGYAQPRSGASPRWPQACWSPHATRGSLLGNMRVPFDSAPDQEASGSNFPAPRERSRDRRSSCARRRDRWIGRTRRFLIRPANGVHRLQVQLATSE